MELHTFVHADVDLCVLTGPERVVSGLDSACVQGRLDRVFETLVLFEVPQSTAM